MGIGREIVGPNSITKKTNSGQHWFANLRTDHGVLLEPSKAPSATWITGKGRKAIPDRRKYYGICLHLSYMIRQKNGNELAE